MPLINYVQPYITFYFMETEFYFDSEILCVRVFKNFKIITDFSNN